MEPYPRQDHFSAAVGQNIYIFGGAEDENACVHWFDVSKDKWKLEKVYPPPSGELHSGACTSSGHHMYLYGGEDGSFKKFLYQLDTDSFQWLQLYPPQDGNDEGHSGPMKKVGCRMVFYENQIILFGGYGIPSGPLQEGAEFIKHDKFKDGRGWTNEMHIFDMKKGLWSSPVVTGTRPPPLSRFSFTMVDKHYAVLFGGYGRPNTCKKDSVYILDLKLMIWSELKNETGVWPDGRDNHAAVSLEYKEELPKLLIIGGLDKAKRVLNDMWIFDLKAKTWKELIPPTSVQLDARCKHSATAYILAPGLIEVAIFGGCSRWPNYKAGEAFPVMAETTVLRLRRYQDGDWTLIAAAANGQLGTEQRISEKQELLTLARKPPGLTMANHYEITKHLRNLKEETLLSIGGALGLLYPHMRKMKPLMEEMVAAWLNKEDNVLHDPTWEMLVIALKETHQGGLAGKIEKDTSLK